MAFTIQSLLKADGKRRKTESPSSDPGFPPPRPPPPPGKAEVRFGEEDGSPGGVGKRSASGHAHQVGEDGIDPERFKKLSSLQLGYHLFRAQLMMQNPQIAARLIAHQQNQIQLLPQQHEEQPHFRDTLAPQSILGPAGLAPSLHAANNAAIHPQTFHYSQQQQTQLGCHRTLPHQQVFNYYGQLGPFHSQFAQIFINNTSGSNNNLPLPEESREKKIIRQPAGDLKCNNLALVGKPCHFGKAEADKPEGSFRNEVARKIAKLHFCGQEGCDYKTDRKNNLLRHTQTMHGELRSGQLLPCCGITFRTKTAYRIHVRESHRHGYDCQWDGCDKVFPRKALLLRHHKIHTGEKTFICPVTDCEYTTNHKSNLERHRATHSRHETLINAAGRAHQPHLQHHPQPQRGGGGGGGGGGGDYIETKESINHLRRRLALSREVMVRSTKVIGPRKRELESAQVRTSFPPQPRVLDEAAPKVDMCSDIPSAKYAAALEVSSNDRLICPQDFDGGQDTMIPSTQYLTDDSPDYVSF